MISDIKATSVPTVESDLPEGWQGLATDILNVLRQADSLSWAFVETTPMRPSVAKAQISTPPESEILEPEDDMDALFDGLDRELADEDLTHRHLAGSSVGERTYRPRPDVLLAILRLARTFKSAEALAEVMTDTSNVTMIATCAPQLDRIVLKILTKCRLMGAQHGHDAEPHILALADANRTSLDEGKAFGGLSDALNSSLVKGRPIILVGALATNMPGAVRALRPQNLSLAPLDRDMLASFLAMVFPDSAPLDIGSTLPETAIVSRLEAEDLTLAVRTGDAVSAVRFVNDRLAPPPLSGHRLANFPVPAAVRDPLNRILGDLLAWRKGEIAWRDVSRGLLLNGPPGTGKTELARILADEIGFSVVSGSLAQWSAETTKSNDVMRSMRACFAKAAASAPTILFIDELDSFGSRERSPDHNSAWTDMIVGGLLELLDGFIANEGVVVIGATNHLDKVDPAIKRAGRFDHVVSLERPTPDLMPQVFRWHLGDELPEADLSGLAIMAHDMSGAEVAALVRSARSTARGGRRPVQIEDIQREINALRPQLPEKVRWRVAVHESGHAIVAASSGISTVDAISIHSKGGVVDHNVERGAATPAEIEAELAIYLAGRSAEQMIFGDVGAGSGGSPDSDLAMATRTAAAMELAWGQGKSLLWYCRAEEAQKHLKLDATLWQRVEGRLKLAEERAAQVIRLNRSVFEDLAKTLMRQSRLEGEGLRRLLDRVKPLTDHLPRQDDPTPESPQDQIMTLTRAATG